MDSNSTLAEEQIAVSDIIKTIFTSCDVDNTNLVHVSRLVEYIKPFLQEDLIALDELRQALDPEEKNCLVTSDKFHQVMSQWTKKMESAAFHNEGDFNKSHSGLNIIDDKELPYTHSTPRPSIGDKLLKCKDLLNLSNVSGYSLSSSQCEQPDVDRTVLEEEIKKLEHQLLKVSNELCETKHQLAAAEDQNEQMLQDLQKLNRTLQAELQSKENLQKDIQCNEELREELSFSKKSVEELKKKLAISEKQNTNLLNTLNKVEDEKVKIGIKLETVSKQNQAYLKELFDIKTESDAKEEKLNELTKVYDELKLKFSDQKYFIDQLKEENELLNHKKSTLVKALKSKFESSPSYTSLGNQLLNFPTNTVKPHSNIPKFKFTSKSKSSTLLKNAIFKSNTSTPFHHVELPAETSSSGISPIALNKEDNNAPRQDQESSEEDIYWKLQQDKMEQDSVKSPEPLNMEMDRVLKTDQYDKSQYELILFEKEEYIQTLDYELEEMKLNLEKIQSERNQYLSELKNLKELNEELTENNVMLVNELESAQRNAEFQQQVEQLKENGIIIENEHESAYGEIDHLQQKIRNLETTLMDKEAILQLKEKELSDLKNLKVDDSKLQETVRELSAETLHVKEQIQSLETENINVKQKLISVSAEKCALNDNLIESEKMLSKYKEYELENLILKKDLEKLSQEVQNLRNLNESKCQEIEQFEKSKIELENELAQLKKLLLEFEEKVQTTTKDSEEQILQLTQNNNKQQEELENLVENCCIKSRSLLDCENQIKLLTIKNDLLQKEIDNINVTKTALELEIARIKTEYSESISRIGNIDMVAEEVQNHIINKNGMIEELKRLNRQLEMNLRECQINLKQKIGYIWDLKNELAKDLDVKNGLWNNLNTLVAKIDELHENNQILLKSNEELKIEYNNLLIVHDLEINKNGKLSQQIDDIKEERDKCLQNYIELEKEHKEIVTKLTNEKVKCNELKLKNEELNKKIDKVDVALQTINTMEKLSKIEQNIVEKTEKCLMLTKQLENKDNELKNLSNYLDEIRANEKLLTNVLQKAKKNLEEQNKKYLELIQEKGLALSKIETELNETKNLKEKITEEFFYTKENLLKEIKEKQNKLEQLEVNNKKIFEELELTKESLDRATRNLEDTNLILVKFENELKQTKDINKELCKAKDTLNLKLNNEILFHKELQDNIIQLDAKNKKLTRELNETTNLLNDTEKELIQTKDNLEIEIKEKHNLYKTMEEIDQAKDVLKKENKELDIKFSKANQEVSLLKQQLFNQENEFKELKYNNEELTKSEKQILNQKLENETLKSKALLENNLLLKKETEDLKFDVKELQSLLTNSQILYRNTEKVLKDLEQKYLSLKLEFDEQSQELAQLQQSFAKVQAENKLTIQKKDEVQASLELERSTDSNNGDLIKGKSYSRQQIVIEKLKEKIENLDIQYKNEKTKNQQLEIRLSLMNESNENLKKIEQLIIDKQETYNQLQLQVVTMEEKLTLAKDKLENFQQRLSEKKDLITEKQTTYEKLQERYNKLNSEVITIEERFKLAKYEVDVIEQQLLEKTDLERMLTQKQRTYNQLQERYNELNIEVITMEERLQLAKDEVEIFEQRLLEERNSPKISMDLKATVEIGVQVDLDERKTINKFTISNKADSPDSFSPQIEIINLAAKSRINTKYLYSIASDPILEVPPLDVNCFADDLLEDCDVENESSRKILTQDELETKVKALSLHVLANSNTINARLDELSEKYRSQYETILTLVRDISHRLRDHVCIGTAEPIVPIYILLEDIKMHLKALVQNASQVGVLISENRMKQCWSWVINYMAMLRKNNEEFHKQSRENSPRSTELTRRKVFKVSSKKKDEGKEDIKNKRCKRNRFSKCVAISSVLLLITALALAISLGINFVCRMTASDTQNCPLDGIVRRISDGEPPM